MGGVLADGVDARHAYRVGSTSLVLRQSIDPLKIIDRLFGARAVLDARVSQREGLPSVDRLRNCSSQNVAGGAYEIDVIPQHGPISVIHGRDR
jgi:hypothetical protein